MSEEGLPRSYGDAAPFRPAKPDPLLHRALPVAKEVADYGGGSSAQRDLIAGVTVAALAIPSAMAYAEVAGVQPINGLYALLLPPVAYALFGSCRQLIVGPEGSLSALVAASVLAMATAGSPHAAELAAILALLVAGCYFLGRLARIGWVADYLSRPVLVGYIHGVAVVLVISQLGKLLGIPIDATEPLGQLKEVFSELGDVSGTTVLVSAGRARDPVRAEVRHAEASRGADRRGRRDHRLDGARPRRPRRRRRRPAAVRPPAPAVPVAAAERRRRRCCRPRSGSSC